MRLRTCMMEGGRGPARWFCDRSKIAIRGISMDSHASSWHSDGKVPSRFAFAILTDNKLQPDCPGHAAPGSRDMPQPSGMVPRRKLVER